MAVSTVLVILLLLVPDVVTGIALALFDSLTHWFYWANYTIFAILATIVLLFWGRTPARRVAGALVFFVLYLVQRSLVAAHFAGVDFGLLSDTVPVVQNVLWPLAWILGWSIARRQTALAWAGLIVALPLVALLGWMGWTNAYVSVGPEWLTSMVNGLLLDAIVVVALLAMWGFDAIGLGMRRRAGQPAGPHGSHPAQQYPDQQYPPQQYPNQHYPQQQYPAPSYPQQHQPQHQQWPPNQRPGPPPTRDYPAQPPSR